MGDNTSFLDEPPSDPAVAAAYRANVESEGYVRNFTRVWSWRPDVATAFTHLRDNLLAASSLSAREVAVLVAAAVAVRGDSYCALAWGSKLAGLADPGTAAALLADPDADADADGSGDGSGDGVGSGDGELPAGLSEREVALAGWARLVARDPNGTTNADVSRLRDAGFGDREIFEATTWVALRVAFSAVNDALGAQPDAQLAAAAPTEVRDAVTYGRPTHPVDSPTD